MATTTTLGFSILSRYSGGGVAAARRDLATLRAQMATINGDLQRHTNFLSGIPSRWRAIGTAAAAVAPALIPIAAAATQVAASFTSMAAAVGVALGAYGAAMAGAISKTMEMAKAGKALSPVQKEFVQSVNGMQAAWRKFISDTQNMTLTTATHAVKGLTAGIGLLLPIVKAIHPEVLKMAQAFESWMKGDSAKNYSNIIAAAAVPALRNLVAAGKDVLNVLGDGFRAFLPLGVRLTETLRDGAAALRSWSDGGGFQRFLTYVKENGPAVNAFFDAFRAAIRNVFNILGEFSAGSLHVLTDAFRALAAINPEAFKAFANALLMIKAPLLWLVLNCPPLRDAMIGLIAAMNPQMIYAVAAAFVALRVAFMIMNTALLTTPLGWLILGLTALGVAIVTIATKTTWFQTAWQYTWNFIKTVAEAIWNGLKIAWTATVNALVTAWTVVSTALTTAWNAVWNALRTAAQAVWTGLTVAWNAFTMGLSVAWTTVSTALVTAWNFVWQGISLAATTVWNGLTIAWNAFVNGLSIAWTAVSAALVAAWNFVWQGISLAATTIWNGLQIAWTAFVNALSVAWTTVSSALVTAWNFVWQGMQLAAQTVWTALQVAWSTFINGLSIVWTTVSTALVTAWNFVWQGMQTAAQAVWTALQLAWSAFINALSMTWTTVSTALSAAWSAVWNAMSTAARAIWTALQAAWSAFITAMQTIWTTVSSALSASWNAVWNALRAAAQAVWTAMQAAWSAFLNAMQAVWNTISAAMRAAWQAFWTALQTAAQAVWNALRAAWQAFMTAMQTAWNVFSTALRAAWQTFWTAIRTIAEAIWHQLQNWWQQCLNFLRNVWNTFSAAFRESWTTVWTAVRTVAEGIWHQLQDWWKQCLDLLRSLWNTFSEGFKEAWSATWNAVKDVANKIWHEIGEVIEKAINGVIGIVNGLIKGFNSIASFLKIDVKVGTIDNVSFNFAEGGMVGLTPYMVGGMAEFAKGGMTNLKKGGTLRGYAPGRDTVPAMLSKGEGVLTPEAVRGLGGAGFVHSANKTFAGHRGAGSGPKLNRFTDSHDHLSNAGFATGGMVPGVQHFAVGGIVAAALARAGVPLGLVSQGEYSNGALSAGTHAGGGVVDISSTSPALVAALRAAGFAAWARTGPAWAGNEHIHAVLMNHPDLSGPARAQVQDFLAGGDGLGAGGGGGGGIDILGLLGDNVGKILKNVYGGLKPLAGIGGALADLFGFGDDEDDGGLFGTGIGPDVGPNVADAVGDVVGAVTGADNIGGKMMEMLGQMVLSVMEKGDIMEGFSDAVGKFKGFGDIAGGFGQIAVGLGKKIMEEIMPDFLLKKKEEAGPLDLSLFGGIAGGGGVQQWAGLAAMAMKLGGLDVAQLPKFLALMAAESGGNPLAINTTDINAKNGIPSQGLMQIIPPNFTAYHVPGTSNNILDPLANMAAAAAYIKARYGGNVPGSPYALGTPGATSGVHLVGEQGPELLNFRGGETVTPAAETASILSGGMGGQSPEDLMAQFQMLMTAAQAMAAKVQTSWTTVTGAGNSAKSTLAPVFTDLKTQLGTNVPAAMTAMATANTTAWTTMATGTTTQWTAMRDGTFVEANDHMTAKMPTWGQQMNEGVSEAWTLMGQGTATAWEGMKEGTRGPTNWIIENSYNNGLARLWNEVATVIFEDGAKQLPTVQALATGGPVRGAGTERGDRVPAMLSRGEHVWTAREVHRAGGHHAVQAMRQGVMGRGRGKVRGAHRGCGFALGGWAGAGSLSLPGLSDLKRGSLMEQAEPYLDALDSGVKSALSDSPFRKMSGISGGTSPSDWMRQYIEKDDELNKIGSGGPPWVPGVSDQRTTWGGVAVNQRTKEMLDAAIGLGASFSATQGSWSTGVAASAGTHDGGGVVDLVPASNPNVGALRAVGFAAWNRGAAWGSPSFSDHIHAVALGDPTVSSGAAAQVQAYLAGRDGLAGNGPDNFSGGIPSTDGMTTAPGGGRNVDPADLEQRVVSYDRGGFLQPGYTLAYNGTGKPEPVGHHLEPKGSSGVSINMPITINGNANAQEVVDGINSQVLPKLRQYLTKGTGSNG